MVITVAEYERLEAVERDGGGGGGSGFVTPEEGYDLLPCEHLAVRGNSMTHRS